MLRQLRFVLWPQLFCTKIIVLHGLRQIGFVFSNQLLHVIVFPVTMLRLLDKANLAKARKPSQGFTFQRRVPAQRRVRASEQVRMEQVSRRAWKRRDAANEALLLPDSHLIIRCCSCAARARRSVHTWHYIIIFMICQVTFCSFHDARHAR